MDEDGWQRYDRAPTSNDAPFICAAHQRLRPARNKRGISSQGGGRQLQDGDVMEASFELLVQSREPDEYIFNLNVTSLYPSSYLGRAVSLHTNTPHCHLR